MPNGQECSKKIEEWEYPNNTQRKRMPLRNSMKGNTLNKLKGMPERTSRKEDILNILKEWGVPLNKFIGRCSSDEKQKEHMNKLQ